MKNFLKRSINISLRASVVLSVLVSISAQAEWTAENSYKELTNSVAKWNPNVPLKYFRIVRKNGTWGPVLTNRVECIALIQPGDNTCVKVDTRPTAGIKFTASPAGPMNPLVLQCYPSGK